MKVVERYLMKFRQRLAGSTGLTVATGPSVLALYSCGTVSGDKGSQVMGFPSSYVGPSSNFLTPTERDPNFEILKTVYREPYWVASSKWTGGMFTQSYARQF